MAFDLDEEIRRCEASLSRMNEAPEDEVDSGEYEEVLVRLVRLRELRDGRKTGLRKSAVRPRQS
jgi:primosomal protein N''